MLCLKLKHLWERFVLAGTKYKKCKRCHVTLIDTGASQDEIR
jgi:hypothetical protein